MSKQDAGRKSSVILDSKLSDAANKVATQALQRAVGNICNGDVGDDGLYASVAAELQRDDDGGDGERGSEGGGERGSEKGGERGSEGGGERGSQGGDERGSEGRSERDSKGGTERVSGGGGEVVDEMQIGKTESGQLATLATGSDEQREDNPGEPEFTPPSGVGDMGGGEAEALGPPTVPLVVEEGDVTTVFKGDDKIGEESDGLGIAVGQGGGAHLGLPPSGLMVRPSDGRIGGKSSTQIIVPVQDFPEESMARLAASPSFAQRHTIPIESTLPTGLEIHRDPAKSHMQVIDVKPTTGDEVEQPDGSIFTTPPTPGIGTLDNMSIPPPPPPSREGDWSQNESSTGNPEVQSVMDEMASAVAAGYGSLQALPSFIKLLIEKLNGVATASGLPVSPFTSSGGRGSPGRGYQCKGGYTTSGQCALPDEVKERILRTLSSIRLQLETVKNQLKDRGMF